jgi:N6-adenosine-specific RNA methylase IME4
MSEPWPFGSLAPMSADIILADPPWAFLLRSESGQEKSAQAQYGCMSIEDIKALPVSKLCRGDAICVMWTTWPFIASGAAVEVLPAWGFRPVSGGAWFKRTKHDKAAFGTGYVLRSACEPFLVGTLGSPLTARNVRNIIETFEEDNAIIAPTRGHSRKPDEIYDLCERLSPRALLGAELFARQKYIGGKIAWNAWGNEVEKFDVVA